MKHQEKCYRNIGGRKMENYSDLCMTEEENEKIIKEAKEIYKYVRKIKHPEGYHQLFVA